MRRFHDGLTTLFGLAALVGGVAAALWPLASAHVPIAARHVPIATPATLHPPSPGWHDASLDACPGLGELYDAEWADVGR